MKPLALNIRQRACLQAIFDTDQAVEADMRGSRTGRPTRSGRSTRPAGTSTSCGIPPSTHGYTEVELKRFSGHQSLRSLEVYIAHNREAAKRKARAWERRDSSTA